MSLRTRLAIMSVALVAIGLVVAGVTTYGYLTTFLIERVDSQLLSSRPFAIGMLVRGASGAGPDLPGPAYLTLPFGTYAAILDASGAIVASTSARRRRAFLIPTSDRSTVKWPGPSGRSRTPPHRRTAHWSIGCSHHR
jgi:hypothetical protein